MTSRMDFCVGDAVCAKAVLAARSETINKVWMRAIGGFLRRAHWITLRLRRADRRAAEDERRTSYGTRRAWDSTDSGNGRAGPRAGLVGLLGFEPRTKGF